MEWVVHSRSGANYLAYATKRFRPKGGIKAAYYPLLPDAEAAGPFPTWTRTKQYTVDGIIASCRRDRQVRGANASPTSVPAAEGQSRESCGSYSLG